MRELLIASACLVALFLTGCKSAPESNSTASNLPPGVQYRQDKDLQKIWLADGFDFTGFDTLLIRDPKYAAKERENEADMRAWATSYLQQALADAIRAKGVFSNVVTRANDVPAGAKTLTLENTIVEYEKGGGGARYFAGLYGAGQPVIKVQGRVLDGEKPLFQFESRRSGDSGGDRVFGGFKSDKDVQTHDIDDLAKDMAEFIRRTAKHLPPPK